MVRRSPTNLKHRNVDYCSDAQASRKVNTYLFRKLENITEDTYEVESCKKSIKLPRSFEQPLYHRNKQIHNECG